MKSVALFVLAILLTGACNMLPQTCVEIAAVEVTPTVEPTVTSTPVPTSTSTPTITPSPMPTIALQNPTWDDTIYFLDQDQVNWNEYVSGTEKQYICGDFACDVCLAARAQGIRCAFVHINFSAAHAIIAFEVEDQGLVYFDPQDDRQVFGEIGSKHYIPATIKSTQFYWNTEPNWVCEPDAAPVEMLRSGGIQ